MVLDRNKSKKVRVVGVLVVGGRLGAVVVGMTKKKRLATGDRYL